MENINYKVWTVFYEEFANKLLLYKDNRGALIALIRQVFTDAGIKLPTLEIENNIVDIDPFSVFALFNKSIKDQNRTAIITQFAAKLDIFAPIPYSFDCLPVLTPLASTFYRFKNERAETDIPHLWQTFEAALKYADNPNAETKHRFTTAFNLVAQQKGIKWNITMGLFWIRPYYYLNLDGQSRAFLTDPKNNLQPVINISPNITKGQVPDAETYLAMCNQCLTLFASTEYEFNNFCEMSHCAWIATPENAEHQKAWLDPNDTTSATSRKHYWIFAAGQNASKWDEFYNDGIMAIGWDTLGDLSKYSSREEIKLVLQKQNESDKSFVFDTLATWQFANDIQIGDVVFVKKGLYGIVGRGIVTSDYRYDTTRSSYQHLHNVNWTHKGEFTAPHQSVQKTLTDLTQYTEYVKKLEALFLEEDEIIPEDAVSYSSYSKEDFLSEVYMDEENYNTLVALLGKKKNIILQGAPGVGKTFAAKRLAYSIMQEKDTSRIETIQFHQSYSYEDLIMGYRPDGAGFTLTHGAFYKFCKKAQDDTERPYFFIIDEINRGNLSKIFGELFMLLENDKRNEDNSIRLLYQDEQFYIPANVHLIGLMNTADRSLAMLDFALRRRFAFFEIEPAFQNNGFICYQNSLENEKFNKLIQVVQTLNVAIAQDASLGNGFRIGHSYFILQNTETADDMWLRSAVNYELIPLLQEYWFDEKSNVENWANKLQEAIK